MRSELLRHVRVSPTVCTVISLHKINDLLSCKCWTWLYIKLITQVLNIHSQIVAPRSKQINTNQVLNQAEFWRTMFRQSINLLYQWSNAMATENSSRHKVFLKTQISHVYILVLHLFPTASEIHHLFVNWFILGHLPSVFPSI